MHAVDLLEEAIALAERIGLQIRHEWLGEQTGGLCRIGSRSVLFIDLSLTADEQLLQVVRALRRCPAAVEALDDTLSRSTSFDKQTLNDETLDHQAVQRALSRLIQVPVAG